MDRRNVVEELAKLVIFYELLVMVTSQCRVFRCAETMVMVVTTNQENNRRTGQKAVRPPWNGSTWARKSNLAKDKRIKNLARSQGRKGQGSSSNCYSDLPVSRGKGCPKDQIEAMRVVSSYIRSRLSEGRDRSSYLQKPDMTHSRAKVVSKHIDTYDP
ncbi:hypothetical protein HAX54_046335 [Datura stramonium]|uniref:Uncharacterized protein n=1 Tax=Datura stramonium TaxID=4076 RepID=A0ABS8SRS0_DATST|nr:hypothetical protein [Datura stramonium]